MAGSDELEAWVEALSGSHEWDEAVSLLRDHGSLAASLSNAYKFPLPGTTTMCDSLKGLVLEERSRDERTATPPYHWECLDESTWRLRVYGYQRAADVELDITDTHIRLTPVS